MKGKQTGMHYSRHTHFLNRIETILKLVSQQVMKMTSGIGKAGWSPAFVLLY
jgi:hypothetical protein